MDSDGDHYQYFNFLNDADCDRIILEKPTLLKHTWTPIPVRTMCRNELPPCDTPALFPGVQLFSPRALEVLGPLLEGNGEILPLDCDYGEYYLFNLTRVIDALDVERSDVFRLSPGRIGHVIRYEFFPERIGDATIFTIPQQFGRFYVTNRFTEAVEDAGLVGFLFDLLWPLDESVAAKPKKAAAKARRAIPARAKRRPRSKEERELARQLLGKWRTQDVSGGGVPTWLERTFHKDGTVTTEWFCGERGNVTCWRVDNEPYRLEGNELSHGPLDDQGEFIGQPSVIRICGDRLYFERKFDRGGEAYYTRVK